MTKGMNSKFNVVGHTVNIASRMSTHGQPGSCQMCEECGKILIECGGFDLKKNEDVILKSLEETRFVTYTLIGKKEQGR